MTCWPRRSDLAPPSDQQTSGAKAASWNYARRQATHTDDFNAAPQQLFAATTEAGAGGLREEGSYISDRTSGAVGSVRALLGGAARAAISSGTENIDRDVVDGIKIDAHAEAERVTRARSTASAKGSATRGKKDLHEQTSTGQR